MPLFFFLCFLFGHFLQPAGWSFWGAAWLAITHLVKQANKESFENRQFSPIDR